MSERRLNVDLICGLMGLIITVVFWFSLDEEVTPLSMTFPKAIIALLALFSVILIVKGFLRPDMKPAFALGGHGRVVVTGLALYTWSLVMEYLGFFVTSVAAGTFLAWFLASIRMKVELKHLARWTAIIAGLVGFFYFIFAKLLHVPLPEGVFI